MGEPAIDIKGLGKTYRLGEYSSYRTIREALASAVRRPNREAIEENEVVALRALDLSIAEGEIVGVLGRNGAGKTTLLKLLARITQPTSGIVRTHGRVGPLLEVGTGFHPELTGCENVFLNGSVLGMSRQAIRGRFDDIAAFSGVERFLDTPLKRYSAGMRLRLAFAVAAHLDSEILAVDEVLAAGDAEFQKRCIGKMSDLGRTGRTVIVVSHDLGTLSRLCTRAVWLDRGSLVADGDPDSVIESYLGAGAEGASVEFPVDPGRPVQLTSAALVDQRGRVIESPRRDQKLWLSLAITVRERLPDVDVAFALVNRAGVSILIDGWSDTPDSGPGLRGTGDYTAVAELPPILAAGEYTVRVWIGTSHEDLVPEADVLRFDLRPRSGERAVELERRRAVAPPITWRISQLGSLHE